MPKTSAGSCSIGGSAAARGVARPSRRALLGRKDDGAWSVPKGEYEPGEDPLEVARREFEEELGAAPPDGAPAPLGEIRQSGGKIVTAWAQEGDLDVTDVRSNTFEMEWPPRSGRTQEFPEVDERRGCRSRRR